MPHPSSPAAPGVGFVAKDPWHPAMRREHHLARELVRRGLPVRFVQAPADAGRLRTDPRNWGQHVGVARFRTVAPRIEVTERSTLLPGSRGRVAERVDAALLGRFLRRSGWDEALTVFALPWEWRAARLLPGRRVFDCTDDWARLLPHARSLPDQLRRIADEADEVVVVNRVLADLFPGRTAVVVPNGADETLLREPRTALRRRDRHAVYVGSVAERFDVDLVRAVLDALPDWTLTVYGQLVFPQRARAAADRFHALERALPGRFNYHGLVSRDRLAEVLDTATVALVPDVAARARGQSSMKLLDYCSRGVPVVATAGHVELAGEVPPHTALVAGPDEMVDALLAAAAEPAWYAEDRVAWAAARTWRRRTDAWLDVTLPGAAAPAEAPDAPESVERTQEESAA